MSYAFDRDDYFDAVRASVFSPGMSQDQVDGQEAILTRWEAQTDMTDLRWLAYMLATTYHETAQTMQPIEEYGKGSGHDYGEKDPETGQTYYGRGFVQLTWRENYAKATEKLGLTGDRDIEWHAEHALDLDIASDVMFRGMSEGWFTGNKLGDFFSDTKDDPYNARIIINNDVAKNGKLIEGYHDDFLDALKGAFIERPVPPVPVPEEIVVTLHVTVDAPAGVTVRLVVADE